MRSPLAAALLVFAAAFGAAPAAEARPTIVFSRIEVPKEGPAAHFSRDLKGYLLEAVRKTNFGKGDKKQRLELTARLTEFVVEEHGDVIEVRCAIVGRIQGGRGARSRISFGGSPASRATLEKQVLKMVANGLVARLAQIARADAG